jgi:hypothetical protein
MGIISAIIIILYLLIGCVLAGFATYNAIVIGEEMDVEVEILTWDIMKIILLAVIFWFPLGILFEIRRRKGRKR